jgi:hypothetical protein
VTELTPVQDTGLGWWVKRDDLAGFTDESMPSGAKIRQYHSMIAASPADAVLAVGCRSVSATQVYLGAMHVLTGRPAYVCVAATKRESPSTIWAREHGVQVRSVVSPGPAVYRKRMREWLEELGVPAVKWDRRFAAEDMAYQVRNLPDGVKRVIVPSGSGLAAAGVAGGLIGQDREDVQVVVGAVASQAMTTCVEKWVSEFFCQDEWPAEHFNIKHVEIKGSTNRPAFKELPDGTRLDPYYAAKMLPLLQEGDVLWVVGRRPYSACLDGSWKSDG